MNPGSRSRGTEKRPDYGRLARAENVAMTPQRPVGSCCRECRFEKALDAATSAKCSSWPLTGSLVALCYCARGAGTTWATARRGPVRG